MAAVDRQIALPLRSRTASSSRPDQDAANPGPYLPSSAAPNRSTITACAWLRCCLPRWHRICGHQPQHQHGDGPTMPPLDLTAGSVVPNCSTITAPGPRISPPSSASPASAVTRRSTITAAPRRRTRSSATAAAALGNRSTITACNCAPRPQTRIPHPRPHVRGTIMGVSGREYRASTFPVTVTIYNSTITAIQCASGRVALALPLRIRTAAPSRQRSSTNCSFRRSAVSTVLNRSITTAVI
jgi:hypothetical protein